MQTFTPKKTIVILETEEQVRDCTSWIHKEQGEKVFIAVTPFALYELERQGLPHKTIDQYYDPQALYDVINQNFTKVENIASSIDDFLSQESIKIREYGLKPAFFTYFHTKTAYDSVSTRVFQLQKMLLTENPSQVIAYQGETHLFGATKLAPYIMYDNRDSLYSRLLTLDSWRVKVKFKSILSAKKKSSKNQTNFFSRVGNFFLELTEENLFLYTIRTIAKQAGFYGIVIYLRDYFFIREKKSIVFIGDLYNWGNCFKEFQRRGIAIRYRIPDYFFWLRQRGGKAISKEIPRADLVEKIRPLFLQDGIDFFSLFLERIFFLCTNISTACISAYEDTTSLISKKRVQALFSSALCTPEAITVAYSARAHNIPVVTWQHGSCGIGDSPLMPYVDVLHSNYHFFFGEGSKKYLDTIIEKRGVKSFFTGSSSLEVLYKSYLKQKRTRKQGSNIILYIVSALNQNFYWSDQYLPFEDTQYWVTVRKIIDVLSRHRNYKVIVKEHPSCFIKDVPVRKYVADSGYENFSFIKNEASIETLLLSADAVIIDRPGTTLLQACTTDLPIFTYLGYINCDKDACRLLKRRAICERDLVSLITSVDTYLREDVYGADRENKEFLMNYGTQFDPNSSVVGRAVDSLMNIIKTSSDAT